VTGASRANPTIRASQFRRNVAIALHPRDDRKPTGSDRNVVPGFPHPGALNWKRRLQDVLADQGKIWADACARYRTGVPGYKRDLAAMWRRCFDTSEPDQARAAVETRLTDAWMSTIIEPLKRRRAAKQSSTKRISRHKTTDPTKIWGGSRAARVGLGSRRWTQRRQIPLGRSR
jgi:hypothetical protein